MSLFWNRWKNNIVNLSWSFGLTKASGSFMCTLYCIAKIFLRKIYDVKLDSYLFKCQQHFLSTSHGILENILLCRAAGIGKIKFWPKVTLNTAIYWFIGRLPWILKLPGCYLPEISCQSWAIWSMSILN
jgi:hypothetical protein